VERAGTEPEVTGMTAAHLPTPPVCTGSQPLSSTAETADMNPEATHRFLRGPALPGQVSEQIGRPASSSTTPTTT
jgi:hypothetical protein